MESLAGMKYKDEEKIAKFKEIAEICKNEINTVDRCDYAADVAKRFKEEADKKGLNLEE